MMHLPAWELMKKKIVQLFSSRTKEQLVSIAANYKKNHKHTLEENLKSECSGHFRKLLLDMIKPIPQVMLDHLKTATEGLGTRDRTLIDVLVSSTSEQITAMEQLHPKIVADVINDVSGDFKDLVTEILKGHREKASDMSEDNVLAVCDQLYKAGEGKVGTDEKVFIEVMARKSPELLQKVSDLYKVKHKHSLEEAIKRETSGHFKHCLIALMKPRKIFIADRLHSAMKGMGTDDRALIFYFSTLSREELREIAVLFEARHKQTLVSAVKGDTTGDYGALLLGLL